MNDLCYFYQLVRDDKRSFFSFFLILKGFHPSIVIFFWDGKWKREIRVEEGSEGREVVTRRYGGGRRGPKGRERRKRRVWGKLG